MLSLLLMGAKRKVVVVPTQVNFKGKELPGKCVPSAIILYIAVTEKKKRLR